MFIFILSENYVNFLFYRPLFVIVFPFPSNELHEYRKQHAQQIKGSVQ